MGKKTKPEEIIYKKMKITALLCLLSWTSSNAFMVTSNSPSQSATALNLFGSGNKGGDDKKAPGMMDQLAMFKKAQEMDAELSEMNFSGEAADGKVKVNFKFVPVKNP